MYAPTLLLRPPPAGGGSLGQHLTSQDVRPSFVQPTSCSSGSGAAPGTHTSAAGLVGFAVLLPGLGAAVTRQAKRGARGKCRQSRRVPRRSRSRVMCRSQGSTMELPVRASDTAAATAEALLGFERQGFLRFNEFLSQEELAGLRKEIDLAWQTEQCRADALRHQCRVQFGAEAAAGLSADGLQEQLSELEGSGEISFMQYFNLHRVREELRRVATSPRFNFWAKQTLGVDKVRLYQDALFVKRPGDGPTQWHSDLGLAPFDSNAFVTVWIALTPVTAGEGSGLCFATGSHKDFSLAYHGDPEEDLSGRYVVAESDGLRPGDATLHHGWTLHAASPLPEDDATPRLAWAVSFVADGARLLRSNNDAAVSEQEDAVSFEAWIRECEPGGVVDHPMLPVLVD
eukprot:TRINITY_DN50753_c0_g1_i1.p1 TRINITY_DN50753_c0_g1~~TRINITY_DN50753_c0_g1_i1.p1  ORF type:complete len:414 (+),score=71.60 TRINITY_DN50753_c0_g1_i1:45-1244(+)